MEKRSIKAKSRRPSKSERILVCSSAVIFRRPLVNADVSFSREIAPGLYTPEKRVSPKDAQRLCSSLGSEVRWLTDSKLHTFIELHTFRSETRRFVSLSNALDGWFDKHFSEIPNDLQERIQHDLFPLGESCGSWWDSLTSEERRMAADRWDYEHDPATEDERQHAWDSWSECHELKRQIAEWDSVATPTALDMAKKDDKLRELRQRLNELETQLDGRGGFSAVEATQTQLNPPAAVPSAPLALPENDAGNDITSAFRKMSNLTADELTLTFVAGDMLQVSARDTTQRVPLAVLNLIDRRRGSLKKQGAILLGMAGGQSKKFLNNTATSQAISRLRAVFKTHLYVKADPFHPYRKGAGWEPRFKVSDNRNAADERAKREAIHAPYEDDHPHSVDNNDDTPDAADEFLNSRK